MEDKKKSIKILIVDDEEFLLRILRLGLKPLGFDVRTANDGEEAYEEILSQSFDVILTDMNMPRLNGVELIYELERLKINVPVIVMTAYANVDTAVKSLKHGAYDYIRKPFTVEELEKVIHIALAKYVNKHEEEESLETLDEGIQKKEKEMIQKALFVAKDIKSEAAKILNISERTLWYKIKKYNL